MYKSVSATAETVNLNWTIGWVLTKSMTKKKKEDIYSSLLRAVSNINWKQHLTSED